MTKQRQLAPANLGMTKIALAVRHTAYGPSPMLTTEELANKIAIHNILAISKVMTADQYTEMQHQLAL